MKYTIEYETIDERNEIVNLHLNKTLIEEKNLVDGNFLVYSDNPEEDTRRTVFVNVPEEEFESLKTSNDDLSNYVLDVDMRLLMIELGI